MKPSKSTYIQRCRYITDYRIRFDFSDGHSSEVDFHAFLIKPGQNPMASQFLDITRFKKFRIDAKADIVWGDWDLAFPFASLYAGDLDVDSLGKKKKVSRSPVSLSKKELARPNAVRKLHLAGKGKSTTWPTAKKRVTARLSVAKRARKD